MLDEKVQVHVFVNWIQVGMFFLELNCGTSLLLDQVFWKSILNTKSNSLSKQVEFLKFF
jgi:hypothetical protein